MNWQDPVLLGSRGVRRFNSACSPFRVRSFGVTLAGLWKREERVIRLRALGPVDLRDSEGASVEALLSQPKRVALLAYLAVASPRGFHRRDSLLPLFWPDADQAHARGALRKAIHIIRRLVGEGAILVRGDEELAVNPEQLSCDVLDFDTAVAAERWGDALGLYRGDLMEGFYAATAPEFEDWVDRERTRLRSQAQRVARALAVEKDAEGNASGAVNAARQALEFGLEDERTVRHLIELLDRLETGPAPSMRMTGWPRGSPPSTRRCPRRRPSGWWRAFAPAPNRQPRRW